MKKLLIVLILFSIQAVAYAQPYKTLKEIKPYKWMVGVHWTAIEDDGTPLSIFCQGRTWNYLYYPTKLTVDRYFKSGWSLEVAAAYTQYLPSKRVNEQIGISSIFFAADVNVKKSLYYLYAPRHRWIDPYFTLGAGYTFRSNANVAPSVPTLNVGFGFNIWMAKWMGLQFHSNAKLGLFPFFWDCSAHTNYLQHSAGLVFRWGAGKNSNGEFGKKKHKWTKENQRYKKKGGH